MIRRPPRSTLFPYTTALPISSTQLKRCLRRITPKYRSGGTSPTISTARSEEHTSELQSRLHLVCRLLLEKKKKKNIAETVTENMTRKTAQLDTQKYSTDKSDE